jgi:PAS domain S-box-containing protein
MSEPDLQHLIDAAPDALVVVDVAGRIALVNRATEDLLGYRRDELLGRSFAVLVSARQHEAAIDVLTASLDSLPSPAAKRTVEVVAQRKDGADVPVEVSLNALETGGRQLVVAAVRDVSIRKQLEQERHTLLAREQAARADAEAAVQLRDAFLATVTHDLRQPLATIQARAQLIDELASELESHPTVDQIRQWAHGIARTSGKMTIVLQELLDVSRLQIGQPLSLVRRPVDLGELIRRVVGEHAPLDQSRIDICTPAEPIVGWWDETRLERVLHNLVSNALKYSPQGDPVELILRREGEQARLEVRDHGIGIPAGDVEHIFEWFHRGANAAGVASGVGLGLAGVRQIVEQHGGSIGVTSEEGRGSTFSVRLPIWRT